MNIPRLSRDEIINYNSLNAFAVPRESKAEAASRALSQSRIFRTSTIQESLGLLSNLTKNLSTIRGNLQTIRDLAAEGQRGDRLRGTRQAEIFGQMRSLSAGIDIIVNSFELDGQRLLDGRRFELNAGNGRIRLNLDNVGSHGEKSLNVARKTEGASASIDYDMLSLMRNASSSLIGLDLSEATPATLAKGKQELEDGSYRLKVSYAGPNSTVEIQKMDGSLVEKVENVDLSGKGQEIIDTGRGVKLSFEKTLFKTALGGDKYDYEQLGPTALYAVLKYEKNLQHELVASDQDVLRKESSVSVLRGGTIGGTTGTLTVNALQAGVQEGRPEMKTGQYEVKVKYDGARSSVWLYDPAGNLVTTKRGIDLTKEGKQAIDLETGIKIELDGKDFTSSTRDYRVYLDYKKRDEPSEAFDYREYVKRLDKALAMIDEQIEMVTLAQDEVTVRYQIQQQAQQIAQSSSFVNMAQSVSDMISGAAANVFLGAGSGGDASNQVLFASGSIFGSLESALQAQANVDPTMLATLRRR